MNSTASRPAPESSPTVLLLGRTTKVLDDAEGQIDSGVHLLAGTTLDDLRDVLSSERVDHVIMGAGLDLDTRLEMIREIFDASDVTTVHMKDRASGPDGFLTFAAGILQGLRAES